MAFKTYQIQKTKVVPPEETEMDAHAWTKEEIEARKAMDMTERLKYKVKGKKELSEYDKRRMVQNEMKNLKFASGTFYEDNPEWFAFETRMRDMILAFVDPLLK